MSASASPTDAESPTDVAVIGAGAAGLAASRRLAAAGHSVLLVEARNRAGGRILSTDDAVELGAEFVHGSPATTLALLREANSRVVSAAADQWLLEDGRFERGTRGAREVCEVLRRAAGLRTDVTVSDFLARVVDEDPQFRPTAEWALRLVEDFDAADPRRASMQAIAREWTGDAAVQSHSGRPEDGYSTLVDHMVRMLDPRRVELRLDSAVRTVRWATGAVEIDVEHRDVIERRRARALVITVPLGVLQAAADSPAAIRFDPVLGQKRVALDGLAMGAVLKVMLRFAEPFWERIDGGRLAQAGFFHTKGPPFRTFWTAFPKRSTWLTVWAGGPRAESLSIETDDVIEQRAIESVQSLFTGRVDATRLLEEVRFYNWQRDARACGAYSYALVGSSGARRVLATPLENTLFFAGEATADTGEAGTVAGAIMSGERVADEVIAARIKAGA